MPARVPVALVAGLVVAALLVGRAQPQEPQTLAECLKAVTGYPGVQYKALRAAGQTPNMADVMKQKLELAKKYLARFPLDRVQGQDLETLARLSAEAGEPERAQEAIARRLAAPGLDDATRCAALATGVDVAMTPITDAGLQRAEAYAAQLDQLKSAPVRTKAEVHARLGGYYRGADVDDRIFAHMNAVLGLAAQMSAADRKALGFRLVNAYTSLAEVYGDREQGREAVALLERGLAELTDIPEAAKYIPEVINRYSLVGKPAAAIEATDWLNAEPGTTRIDPAGRVTLIQFTAHWCGPCRKSYPVMLKLHNRFAKDGLQVVFSTQYYGFFESQRPLDAAAELAADRKYFTEHYELPFRIAIEPQKQRTPTGDTVGAGRVWTEDRYFVSGIPQIVLADKRGIVRLIVIGWDPANEDRVTKLVERLLAEKGTGQD